MEILIFNYGINIKLKNKFVTKMCVDLIAPYSESDNLVSHFFKTNNQTVRLEGRKQTNRQYDQKDEHKQ